MKGHQPLHYYYSQKLTYSSYIRIIKHVIFLFPAPPSSPRLILSGGGAPRVSEDRTSISVYWLPSLDCGGIPETLHYNIYLYDTAVDEALFEKVNSEPITQVDNVTRVCYEVPIGDPETSYGVVVVASNGATVDPDSFTDVAGVQDRFCGVLCCIRGSAFGSSYV